MKIPSEFKYSDSETDIIIAINSKINIITGDSASGKSFLARRLYNVVHEKSLRQIAKANIDFENIYVCLDERDLAEMYNRSNSLIIIDRFDMLSKDIKNNLLNKKLISFINDSRNIFIIMARGATEGVYCTFDSIAELRSYKGANEVLHISSIPIAQALRE